MYNFIGTLDSFVKITFEIFRRWLCVPLNYCFSNDFTATSNRPVNCRKDHMVFDVHRGTSRLEKIQVDAPERKTFLEGQWPLGSRSAYSKMCDLGPCVPLNSLEKIVNRTCLPLFLLCCGLQLDCVMPDPLLSLSIPLPPWQDFSV